MTTLPTSQAESVKQCCQHAGNQITFPGDADSIYTVLPHLQILRSYHRPLPWLLLLLLLTLLLLLLGFLLLLLLLLLLLTHCLDALYQACVLGIWNGSSPVNVCDTFLNCQPLCCLACSLQQHSSTT
jgi:hypothetical protein